MTKKVAQKAKATAKKEVQQGIPVIKHVIQAIKKVVPAPAPAPVVQKRVVHVPAPSQTVEHIAKKPKVVITKAAQKPAEADKYIRSRLVLVAKLGVLMLPAPRSATTVRPSWASALLSTGVCFGLPRSFL